MDQGVGDDEGTQRRPDEDKSVTSQVLEYYHLYSQNRELPKYFRGTSTVKIHEWTAAPDSISPVAVNISPPRDSTSNVVKKVDQELPQILVDEVGVLSPTGSVASNRRLEWDNGADIGYSDSSLRKHSQKSISLPVLNLEFSKTQSGSNIDCKKVGTNDASVNVNLILSSVSSSSSSRHSQKGYILSTSSAVSSPDLCMTDRSKYLSNKVGLPIAESTPVIESCRLTPPTNKDVVEINEKLTSEIDLKVVDKISQYKNMKVLKLIVSEPVVVECAGATVPLHGKNKLVQTSLCFNTSVAVQTDFDYNDSYIINAQDAKEKRNVFYVCHTESDSTATRSSTTTQTSSNKLSKCNSFEYVDLSQYDKQITKRNDSDDKSPLNTLLNQTKLGGGIKELQRSIELLQKLIKSKKYDSATKKYYVKKIIRRIANNKPRLESQSESSVSNSNPKDGVFLHVKKPLDVYSSTDEIQPTSDENLLISNRTQEESSPLYANTRLQRSPLLTLSHGEMPSDNGNNAKLKDKCDSFGSSLKTNLNIDEQNASSNERLKNWRKEKTKSERNFERKTSEKGTADKDFTKITEPHIEDMKGTRKQTTVYVLETERSNASCSSSKQSVDKPLGCKCQCYCKLPSFTKNASVKIGEQKICLDNADLISSEEFAAKTEGVKCNTIVRRFTFEIPLEDQNKVTGRATSPGQKQCLCGNQNNKRTCKCLNKLISQCISMNTASSCTPRRPLSNLTGQTVLTDDIEPYTNYNKTVQTEKCIDVQEPTCKKPICINNECESENKPPPTPICIREDCCCRNKPLASRRLSSNLVVADCIPPQHMPNLQSEVVLTDSICASNSRKSKLTTSNSICEEPEPVCKPTKPICIRCEECKKCNLTKNLVLTDCICSKCTDNGSKNLKCKLVNTDEIICPNFSRCKCASNTFCKCKEEISTSTDSQSSSSSISVPAVRICCCCKREVLDESEPPKNCKDDSSKPIRYALCYPCYNYHQQYCYTVKPYLLENHTCNCFKLSQTVKEIKKTVQELENYETDTEICSCSNKESGSDYCPKCKCRLKPRFRRRKGGLAYSITLESDENLLQFERNEQMESLQEIKIRVPILRKSKKSRSSSSSSTKHCSSSSCSPGSSKNRKRDPSRDSFRDVIIEVPKSSSIKSREKKESRSSSTTTDCRITDNLCNCCIPEEEPREKPNTKPTLQDYLCLNNPKFVSKAENRRKVLLKSSNNREQRQLRFKKSLVSIRNPSFNDFKIHPVMFSTKEMKRITAKNYKNCTEFQQKLKDVREREIKRANRLLYNVFNKKLQREVLKGRHTIPLGASIINLR